MGLRCLWRWGLEVPPHLGWTGGAGAHPTNVGTGPTSNLHSRRTGCRSSRKRSWQVKSVQPEEKAVWDQNDGYSEVMCVGKKPQFSLERMWWLWVWEGFSKHKRGQRETMSQGPPIPMLQP
jgi:hypothetical protein